MCRKENEEKELVKAIATKNESGASSKTKKNRKRPILYFTPRAYFCMKVIRCTGFILTSAAAHAHITLLGR